MRKAIRNRTRRATKNARDFFISKSGLDKSAFTEAYLSGNGIEIGALEYPIKVPKTAKVTYVDRFSTEELRRQYPELKNYKLAKVDVIDDAETLRTFGQETLDFVIASHVLEHLENPILAMVNFNRVLRPNGILFICLPDKRDTFDKNRQLTPFSHIVEDYKSGPESSRDEHLRDWAVNVEALKTEEEIQNRINQLKAVSGHIHFHVWSQKEMFEMFNRLVDDFKLPLELLLFMKFGGEEIFIFKKQDAATKT